MAKAKRAEAPLERPFAATLIGWVGTGLSAAAALACVALVVVGAIRGEGHSAGASTGGAPGTGAVAGATRVEGGGHQVLYGLLFLPISALGVSLFVNFLLLKDWVVAPEVPLGLKMLGHLGRIMGSLAMAACVALCVLTVVCPGSVPPFPVKPTGEAAKAAVATAPRPLLGAIYVLGIFISMLVRVLGSAVSELRTWARAGTLVFVGLAVSLLIVALIFNLTTWRIDEARLALPLFLGLSVVMFLFLLVYFTLPPVVDAFESRRL
ncbi:MAG: hypothetical protein FJ291_23850 [Planctomycetes bacterium]|nr:hypothetical protein [Planctomycetota bacterium]